MLIILVIATIALAAASIFFGSWRRSLMAEKGQDNSFFSNDLYLFEKMITTEKNYDTKATYKWILFFEFLFSGLAVLGIILLFNYYLDN